MKTVVRVFVAGSTTVSAYSGEFWSSGEIIYARRLLFRATLHELPEDSYEAFLSVPLMWRGRVVGVINLEHRQHHVYRLREIRMISTVGFLVGAELELARLAEANSTLAEQLQTRKVVERAKGILQRDLGFSEEQAYLALQRQSRQKRKPMKEIAEAIVLSDEVRGNSQARSA